MPTPVLREVRQDFRFEAEEDPVHGPVPRWRSAIPYANAAAYAARDKQAEKRAMKEAWKAWKATLHPHGGG
jgi:hypothetical protein